MIVKGTDRWELRFSFTFLISVRNLLHVLQDDSICCSFKWKLKSFSNQVREKCEQFASLQLDFILAKFHRLGTAAVIGDLQVDNTLLIM